jgi:hypothetical protein
MKVEDAGIMLLNGQAQVSSGLNNNPINAEAKAKVREQCQSWTSLKVFCFFHLFFFIL